MFAEPTFGCDLSEEISMQMNFPGATVSERKVIRTWQLGVATFYGALCVALLVLSLFGDRTAPTVAAR
jgi:hypothetical protein